MRESLNISKTVYFNDFIMVRIDKTLKEMMEEKPFCRWDVPYYLPQWDNLIRELKSGAIPTKFLYEFFDTDDWLIATDHVRASKGEHEGPRYPIEYYSPAGFNFTGYNIPHSISKCNTRRSDFKWCFKPQTLSGAIVDQ
jgi:hypothetical protein